MTADDIGPEAAPPGDVAASPPAPGAGHSRVAGIALILTSSAATQSGAGFGTLAIPALGPLGVVGMRQLIGSLVLLPIARPPVHRYRWAQWWPILALAASLAAMNSLIYVAFARIDLGMAVTLEFLGPLALGVLGSRTRIDLAAALAAGLGVYVLVLPDGTGDALGITAALGAGVAWAAYIVSGRAAAQSLPGVQASATAMTLNALLFLPLLCVLVVRDLQPGLQPGTWQPWALAALAGLMSSAIPYALDNVALRRVPAPVFAVLMSMQPVMAAFAGLLLLGQVLVAHEWAGIVLVVTANALGVWARSR